MNPAEIVYNLDPGGQPLSSAQPSAEPKVQAFGVLAAPPQDVRFADDPVAGLAVLETVSRAGRQAEQLSQALAGADGTALLWQYRTYRVRSLDERGEQRPLGEAPPQPETLERRADRMAQAQRRLLAGAVGEGANLVLFNVLVALEWAPDAAYLGQLKWAFRRASDFLYDITDGRMAFEQVAFLGPEFIAGADIQIMAANRFHPRSWVGGLRNPEKYMPIRLGRGLWHQRNRVVLPWSEPEAYRTLIHEWAHYALSLKDRYLERRALVAVGEGGLPAAFRAGVHPAILVRPPAARADDGRAAPPAGDDAPYSVVVQRVAEVRESIMATLVGTSELVAHPVGNNEAGRRTDLQQIDRAYGLAGSGPALEGPGRLPLPLPQFTDRLASAADAAPRLPGRVENPALFAGLPASLPPERCWVYVVRDFDGASPALIAQGTLDGRTDHDGFALLGALPGDTVVLVADPRLARADNGDATAPIAWYGRIADANVLPAWDYQVAVAQTPAVDVLPGQLDDDNRLAGIRVRVAWPAGRRPAEAEVRLFPLGQPVPGVSLTYDPEQDLWDTGATPVRTLDGYVLVRWGAGREEVMITAFSQGGGPPSHDLAPVPISAGSSDGAVMLFFQADGADGADARGGETGSGRAAEEPTAQERHHSATKVITTIDSGARGQPPAPGARPWSYPFTLASNRPLPAAFHPTLIVHYATPDERELLTGDLLICRLDGEHWLPQPTYARAGATFVATPLRRETETAGEGAVVADSVPDAEQPFVRRYQLHWIPRHDGTSSAGSADTATEVAGS